MVCLPQSTGSPRGAVTQVPVLTCGGCKAPSNSSDHEHGRYLESRKCSGDSVVEALLGCKMGELTDHDSGAQRRARTSLVAYSASGRLLAVSALINSGVH